MSGATRGGHLNPGRSGRDPTRVAAMVRALGPSLLLLVAAIAAAASTGSAARASARGLARRAAQSLSWLDQADQAEQAVQAEQPDQVSPVEDLSGLALGLGAGLGAGLAPPPCFSSDCGAVIRDTSRDAQGSAGFDTDLEAMEVAAEEAGDNALSALSALSGLPEPRDHPITAHKRTLQYLCENVAVEAEGSGEYRSGPRQRTKYLAPQLHFASHLAFI